MAKALHDDDVVKQLQQSRSNDAARVELFSHDFISLENILARKELVIAILAMYLIGFAVSAFIILRSGALPTYRKWKRPGFAPSQPKVFLLLSSVVVLLSAGSSGLAVIKPGSDMLWMLLPYSALATLQVLANASWFFVGELSFVLLLEIFSLGALMYQTLLVAEVFYLCVYFALVAVGVSLYIFACAGRQWFMTEMRQALKELNFDAASPLLTDKSERRRMVPKKPPMKK